MWSPLMCLQGVYSSRLFLRSVDAGFDERAFVGLQSGSTFTVDPNSAGPAALLGYTHFGTADGNVGSDSYRQF